MDDNLEENVQRETRKRGGWRGFLIGAAMGAVIGAGFGAQQELKHHRIYQHSIKQEIKAAAIQGYAWKEGADPTFYTYEQPVLIKDSATMTMQGYLVKITPKDTINAGPIRKDGKVGYPAYEELKKASDEKIDQLKEGLGKFGEDVKEDYQRAHQTIKRQLEKWFGKEDEPADTAYHHEPLP